MNISLKMTENMQIESQITPAETCSIPLITSMMKSGDEKPIKKNSTTIESSDDESGAPVHKIKNRVITFSDSDNDGQNPESSNTEILKCVNSDDEVEELVLKKSGPKSRIRKITFSGDDDSDNETKLIPEVLGSDESGIDGESNISLKNVTQKSRIRKVSSDEDSDSEGLILANKNEEQQLRMKNKKDKLKDKFKTLLKSKSKDLKTQKIESECGSSEDSSQNNDSNDEMSSIDIIKQKIKDRSASLKMTICDPDTSDEDSNIRKKPQKPKKDQKRTKMISPKPQRMSAKEAMENMHKIKSESNRMLREREVSLPYHRPKALSLQDIMKRRKPAVSSDGKALPIKMNEDQLKQYALLLEQRQKEMMELCKSESEEEDDNKNNIEDTLNTNRDNEALQDLPDIMEMANKSLVKISSEINVVQNNELVKDHSQNNEAFVKIDSEKDISNPENTKNVKNEDDIHKKSADDSAEMELVYNDSIEEDNSLNNTKEKFESKNDNSKNNNDMDMNDNQELPVVNLNKFDENAVDVEIAKENHQDQVNKITHSEVESQLISLHYDSSEKAEIHKIDCCIEKDLPTEININKKSSQPETMSLTENQETNDFLDDDMDINDINMEDIDNVFENAEITNDIVNADATDSPALVDISVLNVKPTITGAPGMVIDLDGSDPVAPKRFTGVELLKERFTFFAKLKTPEEMERDREKRQKPGTQHLKLKQELEDIIAEQRSLEWSKRLENEKQHQMEMDAIRGDVSDPEDEIDKIEAKLEENEVGKESSTESEDEEDLPEDDVLIEDKPKKKNPLLADEAEESDIDDTDEKCEKATTEDYDEGIQEDDNVSEDDSSEEEESSESENESEKVPKKGRILKAFEDSDDEETPTLNGKDNIVTNVDDNENRKSDDIIISQSPSYGIMDSQDDVIQLAQIPKQISSDLFTSQGTVNNNSQGNGGTLNSSKDEDNLGTQSFSIMTSNTTVKDINDPDKLVVVSDVINKLDIRPDLDQFTVISETQPFSDDNLDAVVGMCSGGFQTQNCIEVEPPSTQTQMSQSQPIGDDLLDMCTGKFYDNQFVSPNEDNINRSDDKSQDETPIEKSQKTASKIIDKEKHNQDGEILKSVLDELNEPDFAAKPLKFFFDGKSQNKENVPNESNNQVKKRFVIESDDETNDNSEMRTQKKKKFKKKKAEKRALQISDDEEEYDNNQEYEDDYMSENEENDGNENENERLIEYDSEENEVEVKPQMVKKKKRKATEFFEQEAELTSEDEWVGSGDEDEAGLDRMEREEGDDETFHQGKLQRELGQIHMRDVLDQDKREVRLIQELLFEDGDLGGGGRQRKFRWRNADGEEASGTVPDEFADTQEEEFESEEQWRKQRHEREMFLRQMKSDGKEDELNVSVNRTSIIKANLNSRTMSSLLEEANQSKTEEPKTVAAAEKKTAKDIPSPVKKPFTMFQQNYHGSLLTRGQGALARLAALATPLAADDDAPKTALLAPSNKRNFVFAALTPDEEPKVAKRKAENVGTPRLVKKMKTEEKQNRTKSSLLEYLKT